MIPRFTVTEGLVCFDADVAKLEQELLDTREECLMYKQRSQDLSDLRDMYRGDLRDTQIDLREMRERLYSLESKL